MAVEDKREQELLRASPAMFRTRPVASSLVCVCLVFFSVVALANTSEVPAFWLVPAAFAVPLVVWYLAAKTTSLAITTKRSILRLGILSKRTREVRHSDVRLLEVDQSFLQRLLGVGRISVGSAGHGEVEIRVDGLRNPGKIRDTIDGYRP